MHFSKNNLNMHIKTEPVTVGADATVYVWFLCKIFVSNCQTYMYCNCCVRSRRDRRGSYSEIQIILRQCVYIEEEEISFADLFLL